MGIPPQGRVKFRLLGFLASILWPRGRTRSVTRADLQKAEFSTNTQGFGLRFTEYVRDVFRFRWLKRQR